MTAARTETRAEQIIWAAISDLQHWSQEAHDKAETMLPASHADHRYHIGRAAAYAGAAHRLQEALSAMKRQAQGE